ncbi:twitching motility protein PilT [Puniceicoccaceae bacterium K14]|nr:twitching motility protein PilT [Puniceicoccaceae bacterium K14]
MNQSILFVRIFLMLLCVAGGALVSYIFHVSQPLWIAMLIGALLGSLLVLIDLLMKGFSLRALSALVFGLFMGMLGANFIANSPLFEGGDPEVVYISRLAVFVTGTYLATVIALRGRDEFNLVIPYVKFEQQNIEKQLMVLDSSALVDGRIAKLCEAKLVRDELIVPRFVMNELFEQSASHNEELMHRGKRGLEIFDRLQSIEGLYISIHDSELPSRDSRDDKLLYIVTSLKGRLFSANELLLNKARHANVSYVDVNYLQKLLVSDIAVGESLKVSLVKEGREDGQAIGYLSDGSMVVVASGANYLDSKVMAEITSIVPINGGRMIFSRFLDVV